MKRGAIAWLGLGAGGLAGAVAVAVLGLWLGLRGSLPATSGEARIAGMAAVTLVERDRFGVPTVSGESRADVSRALGFIHGQERFFQMDLLRRSSAGELAELFGPNALSTDRERRPLQFRALARAEVEQADPWQRQQLEAYAAGVNAGLAALRVRPWEYLLLRHQPAPWLPEDSLLVGFALYFQLQWEERNFDQLARELTAVLPDEVVRFLTDSVSPFEAPLDGPRQASPPMPSPEAFSYLQTEDAKQASWSEAPREGTAFGSNAWAVSGGRTEMGGPAILANDMHLGLGLPNVWYRATLVYPENKDSHHRIRAHGLTIPGTPAMIVGSNERIAWGFTNSYVNTMEWVAVDDSDVEATRVERLKVRGGEPEDLQIRLTRWGPVVGRDMLGRSLALHWVARHPGAVDLAIMQLETADSVEEAIALAQVAGVPAQNILLADRSGSIGWTVAGPVALTEGEGEASRRLAPEEKPSIVNPRDGFLWSANQRMLSGAGAEVLGGSGYSVDGRAWRLRQRLDELVRVNETSMLELQLDEATPALVRWRGLLLDTLDSAVVGDDSVRLQARCLAAEWEGAAAMDSEGHALVRNFRLEVIRSVMKRVLKPYHDAGGRIGFWRLPVDEAVWRLVNEQPSWGIDPQLGSWRAELLAALDAAILRSGGEELGQRAWGELNRLTMRHPISFGAPWLGRWIDLPSAPQSGDTFSLRVAAPGFGSTQRLVVAPGREDRAILHMPGGQSGHPLSPHYRDQHRAWLKGEPLPLLPGEPVSALRLVP
jgi:penicillin G amidase